MTTLLEATRKTDTQIQLVAWTSRGVSDVIDRIVVK